MSLTSAGFTTTGAAVTGPCVVFNIHLSGGSDVSTCVVRDSLDGTGPIRTRLSAIIGGNDEWKAEKGFRFKTGCHLTITGTGPLVSVAIDNPQANQMA